MASNVSIAEDLDHRSHQSLHGSVPFARRVHFCCVLLPTRWISSVFIIPPENLRLKIDFAKVLNSQRVLRIQVLHEPR